MLESENISHSNEDKLQFLRKINRKDRRLWFKQNRKKLNFSSFWQLTELLDLTEVQNGTTQST